MLSQKNIGVLLILSGVLGVLLGAIQLTNWAHSHEPNSYVIESSTLNALIENNTYLKTKLQSEIINAKSRIQSVLVSCSRSSLILIAASFFQIVCGWIVIRKSPLQGVI